jgi:hypothetical protein
VALTDLAAVADLNARGIDTSDGPLVTALLASASAAVRDAAGVPITEITATIVLSTPEGRRLRLPGPVRSVAAVLLDGEALTDWTLRGGDLWRAEGWQCRGDIPSEAEVTLTFGLPEVPADIVDLVCLLVGAGVKLAAEEYAARAGVIGVTERVDDYQYGVQYAQGEAATVSPMELPERTRAMLARRFGGGATMVAVRS